MAKRKFEIISEMFDRVSTEVTSSPDKWRSFLNSACRNFKLRYDEQILVYAQKPEATAVLPIERWNRTFGRWVNRGAKGIAVFEMIGGDSQRLVHYFDISDTHASENSRPVPIWNMRSEFESEVIDTLENTFGYLDSKDSIEQAIISAADNAVEDNTPDYISDLIRTVDDSFLDGLGEIAVDTMYRQLVNGLLTDQRERMVDMLALQIEIMKVPGGKGVPYQTDFTPQDIVNMSGIPSAQQNVALNQLYSDQNVKVKNGKINIPDVDELIKQAAFYRNQQNRRLKSQS